jgi:hypothetical protein
MNFKVAEDDIWVFTTTLDKVVDLIADPRKFIRSQPGMENIQFEGAEQPPSPISIQFIYSLVGTMECHVQGVDRTGLVTVRMPQIEELSSVAENDTHLGEYVKRLQESIPDPAPATKRLSTPKVGYAHFNPTAAGQSGYANIAMLITNPELIPAFMDAIGPDPDPEIVYPDGKTEIDPKRTRFRLIQPTRLFRYNFVSVVSAVTASGAVIATTEVNPCGPGMVLRQCAKPSGSYNEDGQYVMLDIEDVQQTLWCDLIDPDL